MKRQSAQDVGDEQLLQERPRNISRRRFLLASAGTMAGALVLGVGLPVGKARAAQAAKAASMPAGTCVPAFLEIRPDNRVRFLCPFMEGGQGIYTAMAQIVGEELDADPALFDVASAPAGNQYKVMNIGARVTGGSMSVRTSYDTMRRLGALARQLLLQAASARTGQPMDQLRTAPGYVITPGGQRIAYGELASAAMDLSVDDPSKVPLKDPAEFRWIGKPVKRLDMYEKSTGKAIYSIDIKVDGMLQAAVQHAPRLGMTVAGIANASAIEAQPGVHSVHALDGAVAVVAERWWVANQAAQSLVVEWQEAGPDSTLRVMPADFSSDDYSDQLAAMQGDGETAEEAGNIKDAFDNAPQTVTANYRSQYLNHAQLEPPSALARFNDDGTLDIWTPNQAPEMFRDAIASHVGMPAQRINIHSSLLGGFFGRHFVQPTAAVWPQAVALARAVGRPVKVIWSREQEFVRDTMRPMAAVRFRAALDSSGMPTAIEAISACEGPTEGIAGKRGKHLDSTAVEGLTGKSYQIPHRRIAQLYDMGAVTPGFWRSVGNSMNDFLYEGFLDEIADAGGHDPYELRLRLLKNSSFKDAPRLRKLLETVAESAGGWRRGPFTASDGSRRARGVATASPFGSHAAAIAEVSIENGQVKVHHLWEAIDPGSIVNPAIIDAQVNGAAALGLSQVLLEEKSYRNGVPTAFNYDLYPILPPQAMPPVTVSIVESGAAMGGIGEPPLPAVPPAVANAVSHLTGQRIRRMPLSRYRFDS